MNYILNIINALAGLGVLAWPLAMFASALFFDAPGSSENTILVVLAVSNWIYPIPAIAGNIKYWRNRGQASRARKIWYTALSASGYVVIVMCIVLLVVLCDGNFVCH